MGPDGRRNWVEVPDEWWWVMDDEEWWFNGQRGAWRWNAFGTGFGLGWIWEGDAETWFVADRHILFGGGRYWWRVDHGFIQREMEAWPWWDWAVANKVFQFP